MHNIVFDNVQSRKNMINIFQFFSFFRGFSVMMIKNVLSNNIDVKIISKTILRIIPGQLKFTSVPKQNTFNVVVQSIHRQLHRTRIKSKKLLWFSSDTDTKTAWNLKSIFLSQKSLYTNPPKIFLENSKISTLRFLSWRLDSPGKHEGSSKFS